MPRRNKRNPVVNFVKKVAAHKKNRFVAIALEYVAPAVGAYAVTHTVGRMAASVAAKRWPAHAHYVGLGAKLATAGLVYYASDKVGFMKARREAILAGVGIALFESLVRLMLPGMTFVLDAPTNVVKTVTDGMGDDELNDAADDFDDLGDEGGGIFDVS